MDEHEEPRVSNIKRGIRACHKEMLEIHALLGNGDPTSRRQAVIRMNNMKKLADSIYMVMDRWAEEMEKEKEDRQEFITSVMGDIAKIGSEGLDDVSAL